LFKLARFLTLLACVPLLWPTGICLYQVSIQVFEQSSSKLDSDSEDLPCCSHCHAESKSTDIPGEDSNTHSTPKDNDHSPSCPCSPTVDRSKSIATVFDWIPYESTRTILIDLQDFKPSFSRQNNDSVSFASDPPIYLSHCLFLI
jgi:hypothetical protein